MAIFNLNAHQARLLRDCIQIGFEGAEQNHTDNGGGNSDDDLLAIENLIAELDGLAERELGTEITVMRDEGGE